MVMRLCMRQVEVAAQNVTKPMEPRHRDMANHGPGERCTIKAFSPAPLTNRPPYQFRQSGRQRADASFGRQGTGPGCLPVHNSLGGMVDDLHATDQRHGRWKAHGRVRVIDHRARQDACSRAYLSLSGRVSRFYPNCIASALCNLRLMRLRTWHTFLRVACREAIFRDMRLFRQVSISCCTH